VNRVRVRGSCIAGELIAARRILIVATYDLLRVPFTPAASQSDVLSGRSAMATAAIAARFTFHFNERIKRLSVAPIGLQLPRDGRADDDKNPPAMRDAARARPSPVRDWPISLQGRGSSD